MHGIPTSMEHAFIAPGHWRIAGYDVTLKGCWRVRRTESDGSVRYVGGADTLEHAAYLIREDSAVEQG